jgi:hypothetical protein
MVFMYKFCIDYVYAKYTLFIHEHIRYTQGTHKVYTRYTQGGSLYPFEYVFIKTVFRRKNKNQNTIK